MPPDPKDITDALVERQMAERCLDRWDGLRSYYESFQSKLTDVYRIYRNEMTVTWPDGRIEQGDPAVPNILEIAANDRAKTVASTPPSIVCHPEGPGDDAREKADKLERIVTGWLEQNRIRGFQTQMWAHDAMAGGLTVCKVMRKDGLPSFSRLEPALSYPDPVFTPGPYLDNFLYAYRMKKRSIEKRYGLTLDWGGRNPIAQDDDARVIEFYDDTWVMLVAQEIQKRGSARGGPRRQVLFMERHGLSRCPVVIATSPRMDGTYGGEFNGGMGVLQTWNKLMKMVIEDAARKAFPERVTYNVVNANDQGPDAEIQLETPDGKYEYVQQPNQPFSNLQILKDLSGFTRDSFIMPLARSGNPDESIISAAGINSSQTQYNEDVRAIQRDIIAPLLEATVSLGLESEESFSPDTRKTITGGSGRYVETYVPSKDINGYRNVEIRYGPMSALDPINQAVLLQQFHGNGMLSTRRTLELNPFAEDVQREQKEMLREKLQEGQIAGLLQRAAQGTLDPAILATIDEAVDSDEVTLAEAIRALVPPAPPQAAPTAAPAAASAGTPESPGIPGAAEGAQPPAATPPLAQLLGGP